MATIDADWYDDPDGSGGERWWDGQKWTGATRRVPPIRHPDSGSIEKGSGRWLIGVAMIIVAAVVASSPLTEWAHLTYAASNGVSDTLKVSAAMSGFGEISVSVPGIKDAAQRHFVEEREAEALEAEDPNAPGIAVLTIGLAMVAAAYAFLHTRHRTRAAVVIMVLSALGLVNGLWRITNVREMFNDPAAWSAANYAPGFGLIAATVAALALLGLSVAALVMEKRVAT